MMVAQQRYLTCCVSGVDTPLFPLEAMMMASAAVGARAKRARVPDVVPSKDNDGPMDVTELSRLVRDLCRQYNFDRTAWFNMVNITNDHASRIDTLEHEALQVTDNLASLMDTTLVGVRNNEAKLRTQLTASMAELTASVQVIDTNLQKMVQEAKAEFDSHKKDSIELIKILQDKFKVLDGLVHSMKTETAQQAYPNVSMPVPQGPVTARIPLIDPNTGMASGNVATTEFYTMSTPIKSGQSEAAAAPAAAAAHPGAVAAEGRQPVPPGGLPAPQGGLPGPAGAVPGHGGAQAHSGPHAAHCGAPRGDHCGSFPVRFPPGYAGGVDGGSGVGGFPRQDYYDSNYDGRHKLRYDSKTFEIKIAQETKNQFDGGKNGISWKSLTRGYLVGRLQMVGELLDWAEKAGKTTISKYDVERLQPYYSEDPLVVDHLLWAWLNSNLTGAAREIFCNVAESRGLEVWRRICLKINDRSEVRKDELYEKVRHPVGTKKYDEVAQVIENWDTNQRLYQEAGGDALPDDDKRRILKKMLPDMIRDALILQSNSHSTWSGLKDYVLEKARELAVSGQSKPINLVEQAAMQPEARQSDVEVDLLDELKAMGTPTNDEILAVVARRANGRFGKPSPARPGTQARPPKDAPRDFPAPKDKEGKVLCANCGATGHDKSKCPKPVVDKNQRPCFICKKIGHPARQCPQRTEQHAKLIEADEEGEQALMVDCEPVKSNVAVQNSFEALAPDSDDDETEEEERDEPQGDAESIAEAVGEQDQGCCRWGCVTRGRRCIEVIRSEFNAELGVNVPTDTRSLEPHEDSAEGEVDDGHAGRAHPFQFESEVTVDNGDKPTSKWPYIVGARKLTREYGPGHPLNKEPRNTNGGDEEPEKVITEVPEEKDEASACPPGSRWGRRASHVHGEHCGCGEADGGFKSAPARLGTSRRRRMRRALCVPEAPNDKDLTAMGGEMVPMVDEGVVFPAHFPERLEKSGNPENVMIENPESFETSKDVVTQEALDGDKSHDHVTYNLDSASNDPEVIDIPNHVTYNLDSVLNDSEVIDIPDQDSQDLGDMFEVIDDEHFEFISDDAGEDMGDTEFLSSIQFQSPPSRASDEQLSGTSDEDASVDEDGRMQVDSAFHQWEVLKCALVPGYVHVDIREKQKRLDEICRRSEEARAAKEQEQRLAEPGRRGRCLFVDEDMYIGWTREEESMEQSSVQEDPRPIDTTIAFLDTDDVEVNVNESDADKEFLDDTLEVAIDSGAGDHVANGEEAAAAYTIEESPGSLIGQHFTGAGGHRMKNMGQLRLHLRADNGKKGRDIKTTFQVAKVTRPLMSVSKICDAGLWIKFTQNLAIIMDQNDKEVCRFIRRGGLYIARMKIRNPRFSAKPQGFPRQGTN